MGEQMTNTGKEKTEITTGIAAIKQIMRQSE